MTSGICEDKLTITSAKKAYQTIVVIDNELAIVQMLEFLLEESYSISTCTESYKAVEKVLQMQPDIIILDIMMPSPDGIQVLQALREQPTLKNIPVILMTAGTNYCRLTTQELHDLKAWLISKPFDNDKLLDLVEKLSNL